MGYSEDIVIESINIWGSGNYIIRESHNNLHEAGLLQLDISKAINQLFWIPRFTALEAIYKTVNWYKNFQKEEQNAKNLVFQDIIQYNLV